MTSRRLAECGKGETVPSLTIERINVYCGEYPAHLAYSTWTTTLCRAIVVEIIADGLTGWGEVSRSRKGTPVGEATYPLAREWAAALIGRDALDPTKALAAPGVKDGEPDPWQDGADTPRRLVREAFCIALYDLVGRALDRPLYALLGQPVRSVVPGMPVVHIRESGEMARIARTWVDGGYRHIKLKVGSGVEADVATVAAVRQAVGPGVGLQVDFNIGYTRREDAVAVARRIAPYGVDVFEDPLAGGLDEYAALRQEIDLPVMVDNYSWWPRINEVVEKKAADIVNHHPSIQGGPDLILRIDRLAMEAGLRTAIGSGGTFGIQDAAFQNMAAVMSDTRPCEDLGPDAPLNVGLGEEYHRPDSVEVLVERYPQENGHITIPDRPGLGVEVDRHKLMRHVVESFTAE